MGAIITIGAVKMVRFKKALSGSFSVVSTPMFANKRFPSSIGTVLHDLPYVIENVSEFQDALHRFLFCKFQRNLVKPYERKYIFGHVHLR